MSDEPEEIITDTEEEGEEKLVKREKKAKKGDLSPEELAEQERRQKIIDAREIIEIDPVHVPVEYETTSKGKIMIGPPTLTRFEKARILGARALQLSLGAPPFIPIPKEVATSLDLAYTELEKRVIPITIRRVLPNGDFQNVPIDLFN